MTYVPEALVLGIGPQTAKGAPSADVTGATDIHDLPAAPGLATGILVRNLGDLSLSFERIESDGGRSPGSDSRFSGVLQRIDIPTFSFSINLLGPRTPTPAAMGDFDVDEYMLQIFQGTRIAQGTSDGSKTDYAFVPKKLSTGYKTLKVWRGNQGSPGDEEAFVFSDCTFGLTFNFVAGEVATLDVDVFAGGVVHQWGVGTGATFPDNVLSDLATAYGSQLGAAPLMGSADASLDGHTRGFQSATVSIGYPEQEVPDCNVGGGIDKDTGSPRTVDITATWFVAAEGDDFGLLSDELDGAGPSLLFTLGREEPATIANSLLFTVDRFRGTTHDKADGESGGMMLRTLTGYAAIGASTPTVGNELVISSIAGAGA